MSHPEPKPATAGRGPDQARSEVAWEDDATRLATDLSVTQSSDDATLVAANAAALDHAGEEEAARGSMVGRYIVVDRLGAGGMGIVYLAYDPELNRRVALKLIRTKSAARDEDDGTLTHELRSRLLREAQALAKLAHPNVITVYDVGTVGESIFIAMAYVEGQTWRDWARERPRSWREVLPVALAAGRGLAAAHAAGLVHRDFKPHNVIIDGDGRAYVLDFGLAHAERSSPGFVPAYDGAAPTGSTESWTDNTAPPSETTGHVSHSLADPLTEFGTIIGTPAYMAPEQYDGVADPRTDQFAFCVSLYEVLYGHRPFPRGDAAVRIRAILRGPSFDSSDRRVPVHLRRVLARGLSPEPKQRYPSLTALLADLERDPRAPWRRGAVAVASVLAIAATATGYHHLSTASQRQCIAGAAVLGEVWNESVQTNIADAFAHLSDPLASSAWRSAQEQINAYSGRWRDAYADACIETHERAAQSQNLLDLRMSCLDRRLDALRSTLSVLQTPDRQTTSRVVDVVYQLPPIDHCSDTEALLADVPLPHDPAVRAQVEALRRELAELQALELTENYADALPRAEALLERARALGYRPLLAEIQNLAVELLILQGREDETLERIDEAVLAAESSGAFALAAAAEIQAVWTAGYIGRDFAAGERHLRHADALLSAAGDPPRDRSMYYDHSGILYGANFQTERAIADLRQAVALRREHLDPGDPRLSASLGNLAITIASPAAAAADEAVTLLREVAEYDRRRWGDTPHPTTALTLSNIGTTLGLGGRIREAVPSLEAGIAMWKELGRADDPIASSCHDALAYTYLQLGHGTKALAVWGVGVDDPVVSITECPSLAVLARMPLLAQIYRERGRLDDAERLLHSTLEACSVTPNVDAEMLLEVRASTAWLALDRGDLDRAQLELSRALDDLPPPIGRQIDTRQGARVALGRLHLSRGNTKAAVDQLEATLQDGIERFGDAHPALAEVRRWLARGYVAAGRHDEAVEQQAAALASYETAMGPSNPHMIELLLDMADLDVTHDDPQAAAARIARARTCFIPGETDPELLARIENKARALESGTTK